MKYALPIVVVFAWAGPAPAAPFSEPPRLEKPQAGFYGLKIGKVDVIAVNDGAASFDVLSVLAKDKRVVAAKLMAKSYVKSPVEASVNAYIILLGGRTILVDAGTGELFGPKLGKLPDSFRAAGVTSESITDVLLTHIHPDHSGGLAVGENKIFPNATIHVNKKELEFWSDRSTREKYPEPTKTFFGQVAPTVGPYITSGQVKTFDGGIQIFRGIRSLPAYGHPPGHTYYALEDGGEKLVFWGDMAASSRRGRQTASLHSSASSMAAPRSKSSRCCPAYWVRVYDMKDGLACLEQFSHMAPIHAHERNGTVTRKCCGMTERLLQEEPLSDVGALQSRSPASRPS